MKSTFRFLFPVLLALAVASFGCRKKDDDEIEIEDQYSVADYGSNDETARNEYDASVDEIFKALEGTSIRTGKSGGGVILPCGVIQIDSTGGKYKFVYGGTQNCGTRVLSGSITAQLTSGTNWSDVGAKLSLKYDNYEVLFKTNNQVLTFNGELIVTNKDGGWLYEVVFFGKTVTHTIHGTLNITFDKGDVRPWSVTKKRIFATSGVDSTFKNLTLTLAADGSTAETGITKDGDPFTTLIPEPIVYRNCSNNGSDFGPFIAVTGKMIYDVSPNSLTIEAGYVYQNKQISKAGNCSATGYKLTYNISGKQSVKFQFY